MTCDPADLTPSRPVLLFAAPLAVTLNDSVGFGADQFTSRLADRLGSRPAIEMDRAKAAVVIKDAILASSLELALLAAGVTPVLHEATVSLDDPQLVAVATLIVGPCELAARPVALVRALRARQWDGLVILITGEGDRLRTALQGAVRVTVLEMPFGAAELVAAIHAAWPEL